MERIEIHPDNVQELWELYENYLIEFRSENYSDAKPVCFEDYVYNEITYCEDKITYVNIVWKTVMALNRRHGAYYIHLSPYYAP